jgi:hypothetical protein
MDAAALSGTSGSVGFAVCENGRWQGPCWGYQHGGSDVDDRQLDPHDVMNYPRAKTKMYSQLVVASSIYQAAISQLVRSGSYTVFNRS